MASSTVRICWRTLIVAVGLATASVPTNGQAQCPPPPSFCDARIWEIDNGNWRADCQGGSLGFDSAAAPWRPSVCSSNSRSGRLTTGTETTGTGGHEGSVVVQFTRDAVGTSRNADVSFMIPASVPGKPANFGGFSHLFVGSHDFTGFTCPGGGKIGAAVYANTLNIEFVPPPPPQPPTPPDQGCTLSGNLFAGVPVSLQADQWYRAESQVTLGGGGRLTATVALRSLAAGGATLINSTSHTFPVNCTPSWFAGTKDRFLMGVLGTGGAAGEGVVTIVDDFFGRPAP